MKKNSKKGVTPIVPITSNCGQQGCSLPYVMPYAGTKEDFLRHAIEKFKPFTKKIA